MLYPVHFLFFRILPKLPVIGNLYALITNGKNRFLSKAEVFGRLSYCGFSIQSSIEINNYIYFIARSVKTESREVNPTLGAVIKLNRIGYGGYNIGIYKFRTMHPYSEFLQSSLYEEGRLNEDGDKINNDFRVTKWGKVLRKLWIDELPQLINVLKGDMSFVGPRPDVPVQKFDYREKFWKMRTSIIPGITGLAQLYPCHKLIERNSLDRIYLKKRSFFFDLNIIIRTIFKLFYLKSN